MEKYLELIEKADKGQEILSLKNITKIYSNGFVANNDINFSLRKSEIHGLVGENGAGKTTLMKVLFGIETPEEGTIEIAGNSVKINNPIEALDYGIGMVHQHFMLVDSLTVAENMALGKEPIKNKIVFDRKKAKENVSYISQKFGLPVDPDEKIRDLSVGYKQRVEILKMLLNGAKILLLDEPTALLTPQETEELFEQLIMLKNEGYSIVFISHKLNEVKQICDRITVLRDGKSIATRNIDEVSEQDISSLMVGRDVSINIDKTKAKPNNTVLRVRELTDYNVFGQKVLNNISFDVRSGEIVGVAAIEGNGQSQLADKISGISKINHGEIEILGKKINDLSIKEIRDLNVSIIHEDRMSTSASLYQSVEENLVSDRFDSKEFSKKGFLNTKKITKESNELIRDFGIKTNNSKSLIKTLSGGNIQKVVAAREFSSNPDLLIVEQPTRGIDIGAADLIRRKIVSLRDELDSAILLFSADLTELISISDSIMVMYEGEIVAYFKDTSDITEIELGEFMLGIKRQSEEQIREVIHD